MVAFQIIPLLSLGLYFVYLTYYYALPMFFLKILLFIAYGIHRCTDIRFREEKITVKIPIRGEEQVLERPVEIDPASRYLAMTVCSEFLGIMKEIRKLKSIAKMDNICE